jgi:hypothetical protein
MTSAPAKSNGFFTFGTGIMVGLGAALAMRATMPRATEFVGVMLQKMGFELGDMLLALWDPEATYQNAALPAPAAAKRKRASKAPAKAAHREKKTEKQDLLKIPRLRRGGVRNNGKAPKLPASRRLSRGGIALSLN